jgi:hypothetical protein
MTGPTCVYCSTADQAGPCFGGDRCMADAPRTEAPDLPWVYLASIIRQVDGNHQLGAGELAERILAHPRFPEVAALSSATPAPDRLDVERLAIAMDAAFAGGVADTRAVARVVAAEYARLTEPQPADG